MKKLLILLLTLAVGAMLFLGTKRGGCGDKA